MATQVQEAAGAGQSVGNDMGGPRSVTNVRSRLSNVGEVLLLASQPGGQSPFTRKQKWWTVQKATRSFHTGGVPVTCLGQFLREESLRLQVNVKELL